MREGEKRWKGGKGMKKEGEEKNKVEKERERE